MLLPQTSNQPIRSSSGPDTRALSSSPKEVPSEKFSPATLKRSSHLMDLLQQGKRALTGPIACLTVEEQADVVTPAYKGMRHSKGGR